MNRFEVAILSFVCGLIIGWIVGYFFDSKTEEVDMPHFIPGDSNQQEND